jgi:hypothetical protein
MTGKGDDGPKKEAKADAAVRKQEPKHSPADDDEVLLCDEYVDACCSQVPLCSALKLLVYETLSD